MPSVRRRAQLAPLDPSLEEATTISSLGKQEDAYPQSTMFSHYISPCEFWVSNDPLVVLEQDVCDATIYGCTRDHTFLITSDEKVRQIALHYYYDLYYKIDSTAHDLEDIVEFLEGSMLEHLATLLGIKHCPPDERSTENRRGSGRRELFQSQEGRKLTEFTEEQKAVFIAINSDPKDIRNQEYACLTAPEEGIYCQSMIGYMILYLEQTRVSDEEANSISDAVLMAMAGGMNANTYTNGAILDLVFIADRRQPPAPVIPPPTSPETPAMLISSQEDEAQLTPSNSKLTSTAIALMAGASCFVFLLAVLILFLLTKSRKGATPKFNDDAAKGELYDEDSRRRLSSLKGIIHRTSHKRVAPALGANKNLDGAEIPGSLAAMDALALRPQFRGTEGDLHSSAVSDDDSLPVSPQWVASTVETGLNRSKNVSFVELADKGSVDLPSLSPVPLSPIRNQRSGLSPSKVSPRRLPPPQNEMVVSSDRLAKPIVSSDRLAKPRYSLPLEAAATAVPGEPKIKASTSSLEMILPFSMSDWSFSTK